MSSYPWFRWYVLGAAMIGLIATGLLTLAPVALIGISARHLQQNLGAATFALMGMLPIGICVGSLLGGVLIDRIGIGKTYVTCAAAATLSGVVLPGVAHSFTAVIALRFLLGVASGPVMASITRLAAEWFPAHERPLVTGVQGFTVYLASSIAFGVTPTVHSIAGSWQTMIIWMALASAVFALVSLPIVFVERSDRVRHGSAVMVGDATLEFGKTLRDGAFYQAIAYVFVASWVLQAITDFTPGYFGIEAPVGAGFGPEGASQLMVILQVAAMIGALASGWLHHTVFRGSVRTQATLALLLASAYVLIGLPAVRGHEVNGLLISVIVVTGFSLGQALPTIMGFAATKYPPQIGGKVGGMIMGLGTLGGTVGIAAGSVALGQTGTYALSIAVAAVMALIGSAVAMRLRKATFADYENHTRASE